MSARIEMAGLRFGRWTVGEYAGRRRWHATCDCGTSSIVCGTSVRLGRSLGCIRCNPGLGHQRTHGARSTRLYGIWAKMISRCERRKDHAYYRYGGRGISVCPAWRASFSEFQSWAIANGYRDSLTIDRRDNNGNYEPSNCRWATHKEQNRNYSRVKYVEIDSKRVPLIELAEKAGLKPYTVRQRIFRMGWSVERALSTPVRGALTFTVAKRNIDQMESAA